jgi:pyridoxine 5'-phosphate synthase PdxJ
VTTDDVTKSAEFVEALAASIAAADQYGGRLVQLDPGAYYDLLRHAEVLAAEVRRLRRAVQPLTYHLRNLNRNHGAALTDPAAIAHLEQLVGRDPRSTSVSSTTTTSSG